MPGFSTRDERTQGGKKVQDTSNTSDRLDQWKGIAEYLGRDVSTVIRWTKENGLPVYHVPGSQKRKPGFALRHELDAWLMRRRNPASNSANSGNGGEPSSIVEATAKAETIVPAAEPPHPNRAQHKRFGIYSAALTVVVALLIAATYQPMNGTSRNLFNS